MASREPGHQKIAPAAIRYIKLGPGGGWEAICLEQNRIDWGIGPNPHEMAAAEDWAAAKATYVTAGIAASTATGFVRELKDFRTLGAECLWITFARGYLWWAFAAPEVFASRGDPKREGEIFRKVTGSWRNDDLAGRPLRIEELSSKLTQLAGYRGTICSVAASDYLVRRINAEEEPTIATAREARTALVDACAALIQQLHWADFEVFVDLLFARAGWRRVSALGGRMKDIDLLLEQPLTGERASVQIKSSADQQVLDACVGTFKKSALANRFFFVCHSSPGPLTVRDDPDGAVYLWPIARLAAEAVDQGLTSWLIDKAA